MYTVAVNIPVACCKSQRDHVFPDPGNEANAITSSLPDMADLKCWGLHQCITFSVEDGNTIAYRFSEDLLIYFAYINGNIFWSLETIALWDSW